MARTRDSAETADTEGSSRPLPAPKTSESERNGSRASSRSRRRFGTQGSTDSVEAVASEEGRSAQENQENDSQNEDREGENGDESSNQSRSDSDDDNEEPTVIKLYKSPRFNGYLTIALASVINYAAGIISDKPLSANAVPASDAQLGYSVAVALLSAFVTMLLVILHLDRFSCLAPVWAKAFSKKSKLELYIIVFLVFWWSIAALIQTSVRGLAGDGKEHFNLYYSTWVCCYTAIWTLERKITDAFDLMPFHTFVQSWPNRAPGWIAMFFSSLGTLVWYVDIFVSASNDETRGGPAKRLQAFYDNVPESQFQWLLFLAAATLLLSIIFVFIELVRKEDPVATNENAIKSAREGKQRLSIVQGLRIENSTEEPAPSGSIRSNPTAAPSPVSVSPAIDLTTPVLIAANTGGQKSTMELIIEGTCLVVLAIGWIPGVIIATTPGGLASLVGNAYFFTWATTIAVMETLVWFIHDVRANVHALVRAKEEEYRRNQRKVYEDAVLKSANAQHGYEQMQHRQELQRANSLSLSRRASSSFGSASSHQRSISRMTRSQSPVLSPMRRLDLDGSEDPSSTNYDDDDENSTTPSVSSRILTSGSYCIDEDEGQVRIENVDPILPEEEQEGDVDMASTEFFDAIEDVEAMR